MTNLEKAEEQYLAAVRVAHKRKQARVMEQWEELRTSGWKMDENFKARFANIQHEYEDACMKACDTYNEAASKDLLDNMT